MRRVALALLAAAWPACAQAAEKPAAAAKRLIKEGVEAYKAVRFDTAVERFTEALEQASDQKAANAFRAICRWTQGDVKGARRDAEEVVGVKPATAEQYILRGMARYVLRDLPASKEDYQEAARLEPKNALAHYGVGSVLSSEGRSLDALAALDEAVKIDPNAAVYRVVRGTVRDKLKQFQGAVEDYTRVIELNPRFAWARLYRARDFRELQDYSKAVDDFGEFLKAYPDHEEALYLRSNSLFLTNDYAAAIKDLNRVIDLNPKRGLAYSNRGLAKSYVGDKEGALADLKRALELEPNKRQKIQEIIDGIEAKIKTDSRNPTRLSGSSADSFETLPRDEQDVPLEPLPPPRGEELEGGRRPGSILPRRRRIESDEEGEIERAPRPAPAPEKVKDPDGTIFLE